MGRMKELAMKVHEVCEACGDKNCKECTLKIKHTDITGDPVVVIIKDGVISEVKDDKDI